MKKGIKKDKGFGLDIQDSKAMSKLQSDSAKAIKENLEKPLTKRAQVPGIPGRPQHGDESI
jgi:hypothetical protein